MRLSLAAIAAIVLSLLFGGAIAAPQEAGKTAGWRLAKEASPYLRQHADNPIEWFAWSEAAFEKARKENKPIFLSVGYSTCYWCHVMERESFENEEIAAYLNKHFVSVKVDRERRPDVDATYMIATELISRGGGWPNSVFLTPELKPFFAVTYQPPTEFKGLAEQISNTWKAEETALRSDADRIAGLIDQISSRKQAAVETTPKTLAQASLKILAQFDPFNGGIGTAPKFPREPVLDLLLHRVERDRDVIVFEAVELALDNIIRGGINDHLAGGFHRYATDNEWAVPHFEKMLYNQALIGKLLVRAHEFSGRADYAKAASKTFDFVLRDMTTSEGGFASAFDAETDGKEGLFYLWAKEEIDKALDAAEAEFAAKALGVSEDGNHEGRSTLRIVEPISELSASLGMDEASLTKKLDEVFAKLATVRSKRPALKRDNKILADWNAAMIRTLAEASVALDEPRYLKAAERAMSLLVGKLGAGTAEMTRVYFEKSASLPASLADHASVGLAAIALYDATRDAKWLDLARKSAEIATERFKDTDSGALYLTASATGFVRTKQYDDGDLPAANAMALELTSKLSRRDRDPKWRHAADQLVGALSGIAHRTPLAMASTLKVIDLHARGETGPRQHLGKGVVRVKAMPSDDGKTARVEIDLEPGWHINAHKPTEDFLLATVLEVDGQAPSGLAYPEPKEQKLGFHDRPLLLYEGRVSLPFDLPKTSKSDGMPVPVSLRVQACSDKICLEPETAQLYLPARSGG